MKRAIHAGLAALTLMAGQAMAVDVPVASETGSRGSAQVSVGLDGRGQPSSISVGGRSGGNSGRVGAHTDGTVSVSGGTQSGNTGLGGGASHNSATGQTSVSGNVSISFP